MIIKSIESLSNSFKSYLQAQNSKINASAPYSFWSIIAGAIAALFLDLYADLQLVINSIFPQNAVGDQVDAWLFKEGLPTRVGETYGTVTVRLSTGSATIAINQEFTSNETDNIYKALQNYVIPNNTTDFVLYAANPGNTYVESIGNSLVSNTITCLVQNSMAGALEETDQSAINRILTAARAPIAGARATDYGVYCLDYNTTLTSPIVTDSIIIPGFYTLGTVTLLGVFPLVGSPITDYILDQGLLPATTFVAFSREATSGSPTSTITGVDNYIQSLRLVGLTVVVGPCITYNVGTVNVTVALVTGYALDTPIQVQSQDINNQPITITLTVEQLIQREVRRAINNQPFGGTLIGGIRYVTIDAILYAVNNQLSSTNGELAQLITNISISGGDIVVPATDTSTTDISYIYDVSDYTDIVTVLQ